VLINAIVPLLQRLFNAEVMANVVWFLVEVSILPGTLGNILASALLLAIAASNFRVSIIYVSMLKLFTLISKNRMSA
jgi:hypothetical protein